MPDQQMSEALELSLLKNRVIILSGEVTPESSGKIVSQLLALDAEDSTSEINLYINTLGGDLFAGMAIYDTMRMLKAPIATTCIGVAFSTGSFLLMGGDRGRRKAAKNSRMMIHLGNSGFRGNTADIEVTVGELLAYTEMYISIYAERLNKSVETMRKDMERDYYMNAESALSYGLIDMVIGDNGR